MKDSEFIELLNLYLDHEISAPEAIRLEAEVQTNPARRKVYQQYCRMQKACRMLTADFQAVPASGVALDKKVVPFDPATAEAPQWGLRGFYPIGAFAAAAACIALIFIVRNRQDTAEDAMSRASIVQAAAVTTREAKPELVAPAPAPRGGLVSVAGQRTQNGRAQPTLVSDPLLLTGNPQGGGALAPVVQQANDQLAWINGLQIAPLPQRVPIEDLWFDVRPATLRPEGRPLGGNRTPTEGSVEMTAFRITK